MLYRRNIVGILDRIFLATLIFFTMATLSHAKDRWQEYDPDQDFRKPNFIEVARCAVKEFPELRFLKSYFDGVEKHIDELNTLNVFPVPDGDTGINMFLTLQAGTE